MLTRAFYPTACRSGNRAWSSLGQVRQIQEEMNRFLQRAVPRNTDYPPVNIWSNEDEVIVQAELPGYNADDIDVAVVQNTLTLRGERRSEEPSDGGTYHRQERRTGRFVRTVELPFEVNNSAVEADYQAGILAVRLPRAEEHKPKKITVKTA